MLSLWTYRRRFTIDGVPYLVRVATGFTGLQSLLLERDTLLAQDETRVIGARADYRNHRLAHTLPDGSQLEIEMGYVSLWSVGIVVRRAGAVVHESHPGKALAWPLQANKGPVTPESQRALQEQTQRDQEQWVRNKPSLLVDVALAILFFVVSKATGNLSTAALVGAGAGLAVVVIQRFVKADLLGGLALFGVFTLLLSAGFSLWFQDERMVQLKGTILGTLVAVIILADALFNKGRYFGARMARYLIGMRVDNRRLALGIATLTLTMALLNLAAMAWLTKDQWLIYTTFVDAPLGVLLGFAVFRFAMQRDEAAARATS